MRQEQRYKAMNFCPTMKTHIRLSVFLVIAAFLCVTQEVRPQVEGTDSPQNKETANKADQNLKSISRVNPSTLAMEMDLPLASYPGRNGSTTPVGFSYSSKLWRMQGSEPWFHFVNTRKKYVTDIRAIFAEKTAAGWSSSLALPRVEEKTEVYDETGQPYKPVLDEGQLNSNWANVLSSTNTNNLLAPCQGFMCCTTYWCTPFGDDDYMCTCTKWVLIDIGGGVDIGPPPPAAPLQLYYVRTITVSMPGGATHEFRSSDNPVNCGNTNTGCSISGSGYGAYISVDGSGMKLIKDENGTTLFMPNGGRYVVTGNIATSYIDPDGNDISFSIGVSAETSVTTSVITDTVGREIGDSLPQNVDVQRQSPGTVEVALPGLNGQPQNHAMTWALLKPEGCETSTDPNCVGTGNTSGGALEDQSQKLFYETRYFCQGNLNTDLLTNPNDPDDPANEVLFPLKDIGIRPCNGFNFQRDANREISQDSNGNAIPYANRFNPVVLAEVELPNGKKYEFKYNRYGEITKVVYPSGSYETFKYAKIAPVSGADSPAYDQTNRGVVERRVYSKSGTAYTLEQRWTYSAGFEGSTYKVTTTAPMGNDPLGSGARTERFLHPAGSSGYNFGFENPTGGMAYDERSYAEGDYVTPRNRTLTEWDTKDNTIFNSQVVARDPRVKRTVSVLIEGGQALATLSETEYETPGENGSSAPTDPEYFAHLNVKRAKSHHYRNIPLELGKTGTLAQIAAYFNGSTVAGISETDYLYDQNYKDRGISSLPIETRALNPADNSVISKTQTKYDNLLPNNTTGYPGDYTIQNYGISGEYDCSMPAPSTCWVDPATQYRGNPTTSRIWDDDNDEWIETHTRYDIFGNAIAVKDPVGNQASTLFEDSTEKPYKYAYPTRVDTSGPDPTNTHGTSEGSFTTTTYDFMTGLPLTATNEFGQTTKTEYLDPLLRPTKVYGLGNFVIPIAETIYDDTNLKVTVRKQIDEANWDEATTYSDSLGRTIKTEAKDSQGNVFTETKYDFLGRVQMTTNPYRAGETKLWSRTEYDAAGRAWRSREPVENQDPQNPTGNILGTTSYSLSTAPGFLGTVVETTDAAQKKGRSITNALGQLVLVDEPDSSGNLSPLPQSTPNPVPTPTPGGGGTGNGNCLVALNCPENFTGGTYGSYSTYYRYDATGKMVHVQQGAQNRYFKYDSLGRLLRVRQPEQEINQSLDMADPFNTEGDWTAGFTYDVLGNVLTATDANGVTITNTYDRAGRVKTRTYSGEPAGQQTPAVSFYYDGKGLAQQQTPNYAKGKLTKVDNGVSSTEYMTFDNLGRLTRSKQITDGIEYGGGTDQNFWMTYTYNLSGALVAERYPSGRVVNNAYESDGDLARIYGKATTNSTERTYAASFSYTPDGRISRLKLGNGLWEAAKFNSRLQVTELAVGHGGISGDVWKLGYEYGDIDGSGSPDTSKNTGNVTRQTLSFGGLAHPFVQTYKYDSLYRLTEAKETSNGNQTWKQVFDYDRCGNRLTHQKFNGTAQVTLDAETHPHINPADNRIDSPGYDFDKNGNLIIDGEGRHFAFNADNKQHEVRDAGNNLVARYYYDGEGRRVKKVTYLNNEPHETTVFVYSSGKLVAEYSTEAPPPQPTTNYTVTDLLGSPRVLLNSLGEVVSRRDFLPFGEEIAPDQNVNFRTAGQKYVGDGVRQKFTGYQKDEETGLDFAEARMYENRHARFTAVDPLLASGKSSNPQTFNRYVYVMNSPLILTDPTGLQAGNWYKPKAPDNQMPYRYIKYWEQAPETYELVQKDALGRLTGPGVGLATGRVVELNPRGPGAYPDLLTFTLEMQLPFFMRASWYQSGYREAWSAEFLDLYKEPNPALEDASLGFYGGVFGVFGAARAGVSSLAAAASLRYFGSAPAAAPEAAIIANRALGLAAEAEVGITGAKRSIESITRTAARRFPDEITDTTMTEVKNVRHLNLTSQIMGICIFMHSEKD